MSTYCIVASSRPGLGTEYRVEQHFSHDSMPSMIQCKPVFSLETAKAQGEDLWLTNAYETSLQSGTPMPERVYWSDATEAEGGITAGIIGILRMSEPGSPPVEKDTWKLWHTDLFDRECPMQLEVKGEGLKRGLVELWIRHLHEGVNGFSRFALSWRGGRKQIEIESRDMEALNTLRNWVFQLKGKDERVERKNADFHCLVALAVCHARLIEHGQTIEPILHLAQCAPDVSDFVLGLEEIGNQ